MVDLRFPEYVHTTICCKRCDTDIRLRAFNIGSPWNVPAGQGGANIDHVIAKYRQEAYEENEKKLQQIRENNVPSEQPMKGTLIKATSAGQPGS